MQHVGPSDHLDNDTWNQDQPLRVMLVNDPPFTYIDRDEQGNVTYRGYLVELWQLISESLDISYRFLPQPAGEFGTLLANGTWTGMVGQCVQKKGDVALSWFMYSHERSRVVEYVDMVPTFPGDYDFYVRSGKSETPRLTADMVFSLLRPLDTNVWLLLLLSLLLLAVMLTVTVRLSPPGGETDAVRHQFDLGSNLLRSWMTVAGQGWDVMPDSTPARVVAIFSWILGILISVNYTANLISYVTVSQPEAPIKTLKEFVSARDWTLATERGISSVADWRRSSDPDERLLEQRLQTGDRFLALDGSTENLRRATGPKTLLYFNLAVAFTLIKEEACQLKPLVSHPPVNVNSRNYMLLRKGLKSLRRAINTTLLRLMRTGALYRVKRRWFDASRQQCSDEVVFQPLTLADLLAVVVIMPVAAAGCCLMLTAELLCRRLRRGCGGLPGPGPLVPLRPAKRTRRRSERSWSASQPTAPKKRRALVEHMIRYE